MTALPQDRTGHSYNSKGRRPTSPLPHYDYETYYKHQEKDPVHTNSLLQYLSNTELKHRNDNLYETEALRLPRRTDILNRYIKMNSNFEHLNRVYEPNLTNIEKQRYRRCLEQQQQKLYRIKKKFDFQTADGHDSHYFLTGARYNRFDTIDSKILLKYGTFVNRNNPEQVDIKPSHFKKFREILQAQQRSSSTGASGGDTTRRETEFDFTGDRKQDEDLDDLTNRYERSSSRQSNLKPVTYGKRTKLPKIQDPARYVDVASQMPERRRGRRSLDRAISSSSTHRSNRHRRQSQHQQSPAPQTSVSYVANKVSFSLVNESNPSTQPTNNNNNNKQTEEEYELITTDDDHQYYPQQQQQQQQQHIIPRETMNEDDDEEEETGKANDDDDEEEDLAVVEQLREQANALISNILASAIEQITLTSTN